MQRFLCRVRRVWAILFFTTLIGCLCLGHPSFTIGQVGLLEIATAQSPPLTQLVQQGLERYQTGDVTGAIQSWQKVLSSDQQHHNSSSFEISVRTYLARAYQQVGQFAEAIAQLDQVIAYYRQKNELSNVGRMLTEQAQIYTRLGQHRRAVTILCGQNHAITCSQDSALGIAQRHSDYLGEVAAWGSLGNTHRLQGEYDQAIQDFERSNEIAKRIDNQTYIASTLNGLANTYAFVALRNERRVQFAREVGDQKAVEKFQQETTKNRHQAVRYFEQSVDLARSQNDKANEVRSLLGLVRLYHRQHLNNPDANNTLQQAMVVNEQLSDSRDKAYGAIQLAHLLPDFSC